MKWPMMGLAALGVFAAIAATVMMVALRAGGDPEANADTDTVEILVATRNLPAIVVVAAADVATRRVQKSEVPEKALTSSVQILGQVLIAPVLEGQVFTQKQLATPESGVSLAATLTEGHRAMGVVLSDDTGIENVLYPGSVVDVIASFKLPALDGSSSPEVVSATILQGVQVLGIGPRTIVSEQGALVPDGASSKRRERTIMLMVDVKQAEMLNLAATHGKVSVSLRNPLDQEREKLEGTRMSDLSRDLAERIKALTAIQDARVSLAPREFPEPAEPAPVAAAPPAAAPPPAEAVPAEWVTTVLRGRMVEKQKFDLSEDKSR